MAVGYIEYIKARRANDNQPITHTRIGDKSLSIYGGKYYIPENELPTFHKLYHEHVIKNNNPEYLTEKQLDNSPILIDIDMRYSTDITERQHNLYHIVDMFMLYMYKLKDICNIKNGDEFPIYIMEKDNVNKLEDKTKDGIHVIIGASANKAVQQLLRQEVIYDLPRLWEDLPLTNSFEDIIDEAVCKGNCNWQMFGSCKPNHEAYKLTHFYKCKYNEEKEDFDLDKTDLDLNNFDNFKLLSAQYTNYKKLEPCDEWIERVEKFKNVKKEKPKKLVVKTETKSNDNLTLQYAELIEDEYLSNREDWLKIVYSMKIENVNEADALRISNKATDCVPLTEQAWDNVWNRAWDTKDNDDRGCTIGTIKYYAKLSNPYEYHKLELVNMKYYEEILKVMDSSTELKLAELFYKICDDRIIYLKDEDKFYTWYNNKWNEEVKKNGSYCRRLINYKLSKIINDYMIKLLTIRKYKPEPTENNNNDHDNKLIQKSGDLLVLLEKTTWLNNVWNELQSIIISSNKEIEFDNNPNIIAFNNYKFDFIKKEFTKIEHYDYITMYTKYDWVEPTEEQINLIKKLFEEIFPNADRRECYLSVLYSCCIGGVKDKFIIANGSGSNGKGTINEIIYDMLGDYAYEGNTNVLTEKLKNGANPELANLNKKRFCIYKEFNTDDKLRLDTLKKLVDNPFINARGLYQTKTETKLEATHIMEVNNRIKFSGKIGGDSEARRLVDILFESTFSNDPDILNDKTRDYVFERDNKLKDKIKAECKCALFKYIIDNARKEIYVPDIVKARTNEYIDKNDDLLNWFNENYELTKEETDIVKVKDVFELYKESDEYLALYKKERPNLSAFTEDIRSNKHLRSKYKERIKIQQTNTTLRSVLQGVKRIYDCDNDSDDE